jgi:tetratricopeptide (TPR) repeat protein
VLELHAIAVKKAEGGGRFAVAMTAQQKRRFLDGVSGDPGAYYNMLGRVNVERSECSRAADRESIHAGIRDSVGFGALGRMVFGVMEEWMVEELRAEVAARQRNSDEKGEMRWSLVMGNVLRDQGRREEAVEFEERALKKSRHVLSKDDAERGVYMNNLAITYGALGRHEEALAMQESVLEFRQRVLPPDDPDIGDSMNNLAIIYGALGRHEDALVMQKSVLEFRQRVLPPDHPDIGGSMGNLAITYGALGRHEEALVMHESALEFRQRVLFPDHPDIGDSMGNLAITYGDLGRHEEALAMQESALEFRRRVLPSGHPDIAMSLHYISWCYEQAGDMRKAMDCAREAVVIWQAALPAGHPHLKAAEDQVRHFEKIKEYPMQHAAAVQHFREAGSVAVLRHRGSGCAGPDYMLQFDSFNTFVADVKLKEGCFYYEVLVVEIVDGGVQFGFCSGGFESREHPGGEGAGDDASSWGVCGLRQQKWHAGSRATFGSEWRVGDVLGFAVDMRPAGGAVLSVSVNGSFAAPNGVAFSGIDARYLSPALSGHGRYQVNFGDRAFAHALPSADFMSVHDFRRGERDA